MGWTIATIILIIIVTSMGFALRNLLVKNEKILLFTFNIINNWYRRT